MSVSNKICLEFSKKTKVRFEVLKEIIKWLQSGTILELLALDLYLPFSVVIAFMIVTVVF